MHISGFSYEAQTAVCQRKASLKIFNVAEFTFAWNKLSIKKNMFYIFCVLSLSCKLLTIHDYSISSPNPIRASIGNNYAFV
jgi:hypothetical protein